MIMYSYNLLNTFKHNEICEIQKGRPRYSWGRLSYTFAIQHTFQRKKLVIKYDNEIIASREFSFNLFKKIVFYTRQKL